MVFVDVQGTLISDIDKKPIRGSIEFLRYLKQEGIAYMVVTNNSKTPSEHFRTFLNDLGFDIAHDEYLDPLMMLQEHTHSRDIAAYGDDVFLSTLKSLGFTLNYTNPTDVVVSLNKAFCNEDFADMIEHILNGAHLLGMHATTLYAKEGKRYPGTAAILQMLKHATMHDFTIVGKPSTPFYAKAKHMLQERTGKTITFEDIVMISDDVQGDLVGAKSLGMRTGFVLSGKYKNANEVIPFIDEQHKPDDIFKDLHEVLTYMQGSKA